VLQVFQIIRFSSIAGYKTNIEKTCVSYNQKLKYSQVPVAHAIILATQEAEIRRIAVGSQANSS
jgi:hypothetical protein